MDRDACQFLELEEGRRIAFAEYGTPAGRPVFFFHGWPSSRMMAELTDLPARELGLRIISPDRPGIWDSTFQANRRLLDWPPVVEALANHLGIRRFHVLAISGGAPYAFATGHRLGDRVRALGIISGAVPFSDLTDHRGLLPLYRWMIWFYRHQPRLLRAIFYLVRPIASLELLLRMARSLLRTLPPADAEALRDSRAFNICFESQRKAWGSSADGVIADAEIYGRPWGFELSEVRVPVRLWHGKQDRAFAFQLAEDVAKRLPNCVAKMVDNEGHFSLPIRHMREILSDLVAI